MKKEKWLRREKMSPRTNERVVRRGHFSYLDEKYNVELDLLGKIIKDLRRLPRG